MTPNETADSQAIAATLGGEAAAFAGLVSRHQRSARSYARAVLRDASAAEDAVQEAFVDAFLKLGQLDDPSKFGGWLRRIVFKQCDRIRRKRRIEVPEEGLVTERSPEDAWLDGLLDKSVRQAVERLAEHERVVLALHYFAGLSVSEIATFLSVSEPTIKKRLFLARKRLQAEEVAMSTSQSAVWEDREQTLANRIELFLSLRSGDAAAVERVLARAPELVNEEESWSDDDALAGGFTLAHHITPIILAAGYGDADMVKTLLERGAPTASACGCDNGESALWAATRAGHVDVVRALLDAGADVNATNAKGVTSLDLAHWRGDAELVTLLEGADGKRGVAIDTVMPSHAGFSEDGNYTTGIRAIDLWCPLQRGDVVRVVGAAETGLTVLLTELAVWASRAGGHTVWTSWETQPWHRKELDVLAARGDAEVTTVVGKQGEDGSTLQKAMQVLAGKRASHGFVVHVIFEQEGRVATVDASWPQLGPAADITFVVRPWAQVTTGAVGVPKDEGPHTALLVTSSELAEKGLFPAIDPLASRGSHSTSAADEARHEVSANGPRKDKLLSVLTQPFAGVAPDTGMPGFSESASRTTELVRRVLDGAVDGVDESSLRYRAKPA